MLRKLTIQEFDQYVDYAYQLAMDLSKASFPVFTDGVKTKETFLQMSRDGMANPKDEILLYEQDNEIKGWIHYFTLKEDHYLNAINILVSDGYGQALKELLAYWKQRFPGYMYWTSDKIYQTFDDWVIYGFVRDGVCLGTIYYNGSGEEDLEIFGIDSYNAVKEPDVIEALLISALNRGKEDGGKSMYLFCDKETDEIAEKLDFRCVTEAHYFKVALG